jgi:hypothetical protein
MVLIEYPAIIRSLGKAFYHPGPTPCPGGSWGAFLESGLPRSCASNFTLTVLASVYVYIAYWIWDWISWEITILWLHIEQGFYVLLYTLAFG